MKRTDTTAVSGGVNWKTLNGTVATVTIDSAGRADCYYDGTDFLCDFGSLSVAGPDAATIHGAITSIGTPYVYLNASLETEYSDEASADTLHDFSGNNRHFYADLGEEPTYDSVSAISGLPAFRFDSTQWAQNATLADWIFLHSDSSTVFIVTKTGDSANPNFRQNYYGTSAGSSSNIGVCLSYDDRSGSGFSNQLISQCGPGTGLPVYSNTSLADAINPNVYRNIIHLSDPANGTAADRTVISVSGGADIKNNLNSEAPSGSNPTYAFQIGAGGNDSRPAKGEIAVFVIWDRILTASEITQLQTAYNNEY